MIYFLLIFISVLALYLVYRLFLLKRAVSSAEKELRSISDAPVENRIVKLAAPDRELEELLKAINGNLETVRKERLECLRHEQRLKEQIENISHDLRTPLTAILGYLKMIDTVNMSVEDKEYLDIAIRKSHMLQTLVTQFYELTRVTSEEFQLELTQVDIARILKETSLEYYELIEKEKIQFHMDVPGVPVIIQGDAQALERIFSNLLQNSMRYAKSEFRIRLLYGFDGVQLIFENDIDPETEIDDPDRLFDRFYIQEKSRSRGGTGLGLTISKYLIEAMNGTIEAEYHDEEGCVADSSSGDYSAVAWDVKEKRILAFTLTFPCI